MCGLKGGKNCLLQQFLRMTREEIARQIHRYIGKGDLSVQELFVEAFNTYVTYQENKITVLENIWKNNRIYFMYLFSAVCLVNKFSLHVCDWTVTMYNLPHSLNI